MRSFGFGGTWLRVSLVAGVLCVACLAKGGIAAAARPSQLWSLPAVGTAPGPGAGQLHLPRGVGVDPANGHVYVADLLNARIDELTAWGRFVRAWGWGVDDGTTAALQSCSVTCFKGIEGANAGQIAIPFGVAVDAARDVYVDEPFSLRVQKFDSEGHFLAMFGGEVNKTTGANLCTKANVEAGNVCGVGISGPGNGQFESPAPEGNKIAIGPDGDIFVGDRKRIQEFDPSGTFKAQVALPGEAVQSLAIDKAGNFYVGLEGKKGVSELSPTGSPLRQYPVENLNGSQQAPLSLAVDGAGDLYTIERRNTGGLGGFLSHDFVAEFAPDGTRLLPSEEEEEAARQKQEAVALFGQLGSRKPPEQPSLNGLATSEACQPEAPEIFISANFEGSAKGEVSNLRAFGQPPTDFEAPCEAPPAVPPTIADQYATTVGAEGAVVQAKINPHFWPDATYQVQYGTGKCSEGGCPSSKPASPAALEERVFDEAIKTAEISLGGLQPDTTYHYRFIAQSSGGSTVGEEGALTTASPPLGQKTACPNQAFRTGPSAFLPDCRADEMVSPIDKNGADIVALINIAASSTALDVGASDGEKLTYTSFRAFGDAQGAPYAVQYIASRHQLGSAGEGWSTHAISPPRGINILEPAFEVDSEFRFFSPDLCESWLLHDTDPVLAPGAVSGYPNLYKRYECGPQTGTYEAVSTAAPPPSAQAGSYTLDLQGVSADGSKAAFQVAGKLTGEANEGTNMQCYDWSGETAPLRLISRLPDGTASSVDCALGTDNLLLGNDIRSAQVTHAMSTDGSKVYWSAGTGTQHIGQIYLRLHPDQPQSAIVAGACTESERACTVEVSGKISKTEPARFYAAAADGSQAIFEIEGSEKSALFHNLYEYSASSGAATLIAKKVIGLLGASDDAARTYFVSEETLGGGVAGKPNLYFREVGQASRFVATLSAADAATTCSPGTAESCVSTLNFLPNLHTALVSADGQRAVFASTASLTGFDNADAQSGAADAEVFLYDATAEGGGGKLVCVSCNPTGARPQGRELVLQGLHRGIWAAAQIPLPHSQLQAPRALSADGSRLFFETTDPLVLRDTNGRRDVYEWESDESQAQCEEDGAELYVPANGGCLSLISSGQSELNSEVLDISPDGRDVFFATASSLVPQDPGLIDVYDAREGGGFPAPAPTASECEGAACQNPPPPPGEVTPASAALGGQGNLSKEDAKKPPGKKHHKRKGRHARRHAHRHGRAGR